MVSLPWKSPNKPLVVEPPHTRGKLEHGAFQLGDFENKWLGRGLKINVGRSTKKVYIPRTRHYAPTVLTEEKDGPQLESVYDDLQPCVVTKGLFGWGWHRCPSHYVYIAEED